MSEAVLDASALLALLNGEPGAEQVAALLPKTIISTVNLSEVVAKLVDSGMPRDAVVEALSGLGLKTVPFDEALAFKAGFLRVETRQAGLSLGDRACLALALLRDLPALTTDRSWGSLALERIMLIR